MEKKIEEWIDNYDLPIDKEQFLSLTEQVAEDTCKTLLYSICKKIGILEGIKKANDILKYKFDIGVEIDTRDIEKDIEDITRLEMKSLAVGSSTFSEQRKNEILAFILESIKNPEQKKVKSPNDSLKDILKSHLEKIYRENGELPNSDINSVKMVRDSVVERPSKLRKKSK